MMTELVLQTPEVFKPLDQPSRYKGAYGGRGSGKSWHFASMVVEHCLLNPGAKVVCIREVQKTLNQSAKALIESKIQELGVGSEFRVMFDRIETPGGGLIIFQGMQDQNAESIKSLEGYNIKHGVKMTGMPAWGVTHSDELLWDVVALLRKLPELTKEQYEALVENAPKHDELMQEMGGGHQHGGKHE